MVIYQNSAGWLNGLLIFYFACYVHFDSFREGTEGISALMIDSDSKCQIDKKLL
jgi:hypothetical protein